MLYSFIPPILIVLSVSGIIILLVRKAPEISRAAGEEERRKNGVPQSAGNGFLAKYGKKNESAVAGEIKSKGLIMLEKATRRLKIVFLRLENKFSSWSENLRKKRNSISDTEGEAGQEAITEDALDKLENYRGEEPGKKKVAVYGDEPEKRVRPMISDEVITPKIAPEKKARLEKILIERIAGNPRDIEAYERLGEYYFEMANYDHAKECFKQVIKLDPTNSSVKNRMRKLERLLVN